MSVYFPRSAKVSAQGTSDMTVPSPRSITPHSANRSRPAPFRRRDVIYESNSIIPPHQNCHRQLRLPCGVLSFTVDQAMTARWAGLSLSETYALKY
jgi:hypothetical protein